MSQDLHGTYAIEHNTTKVGQLTVSAAGIRTRFQAECVVVTGEVLRLNLLVGEVYIPLGVVLPSGDKLLFDKRYSRFELQTKGITAIHGVRLVGIGQAAPAPPTPAKKDPEPTAEPEPTQKPEEPEAEPAIKPQILIPPVTPVSGPAPEPTEPPPDNNPIYTDETRFTASSPVADEDLDDIDPYPAARPSIAPAPDWSPCPDPAALFTDSNLMAAGARLKEAMTRSVGEYIELAVPFDAGKPFPLMPIFCHGVATDISGRAHLVFRVRDGVLL